MSLTDISDEIKWSTTIVRYRSPSIVGTKPKWIVHVILVVQIARNEINIGTLRTIESGFWTIKFWKYQSIKIIKRGRSES